MILGEMKMSIQHLEESKRLRKAFYVLDREGIAKRAIEICKEIAESENYKESIEACGKMHALYISCKADDYWDEKAWKGYKSELYKMEGLL